MTRLTPYILALSLLPLTAVPAAHAAPMPLTLPSRTHAPVSFEAHIHTAENAVRAHLPQMAVPEYQAALRQRPADADAHYALGGVWEILKRPADAEREYQRTIQLDPAHAAAHSALAGLLDDRGQLAAALAQSQQALALELNNAALHCNQGDLLTEAKRWPEARREYETALRLRPGLPQARQGLAALPVMAVPKPKQPVLHQRGPAPGAGYVRKIAP